ncbi:hypothetical protein JHK82_022722 [Glycine max]|nr:hypothetical protein JHK82_022722 [Glycine max]
MLPDFLVENEITETSRVTLVLSSTMLAFSTFTLLSSILSKDPTQVKPIRYVILQALKYWTILPAPLDTPDLFETRSSLKSGIYGWGLFTRRDIQEGEMVVEYHGVHIRPGVGDLREEKYHSEGYIYLKIICDYGAQSATKTTFLAATIRKCSGNEEKGKTIYNAYGSNGQLFNSDHNLQKSPFFIVVESYGGKFVVTLGLSVIQAIHKGKLKLKLGAERIKQQLEASQFVK